MVGAVGELDLRERKPRMLLDELVDLLVVPRRVAELEYKEGIEAVRLVLSCGRGQV